MFFLFFFFIIFITLERRNLFLRVCRGKGREGCGCKREREGDREKIRGGGEGKDVAGDDRRSLDAEEDRLDLKSTKS